MKQEEKKTAHKSQGIRLSNVMFRVNGERCNFRMNANDIQGPCTQCVTRTYLMAPKRFITE